MPASQPGNSTAVVVRPPFKEQVKALVAGAPEMFKWTSALVKLMEFLVKDDEELFYGFDEPTTWRAWRATVGKQAAMATRPYKGIYLHWCRPDIAIRRPTLDSSIHMVAIMVWLGIQRSTTRSTARSQGGNPEQTLRAKYCKDRFARCIGAIDGTFSPVHV